MEKLERGITLASQVPPQPFFLAAQFRQRNRPACRQPGQRIDVRIDEQGVAVEVVIDAGSNPATPTI